MQLFGTARASARTAGVGLVAGVLLAGCGNSTTSDAEHTAAVFASAVSNGDASKVCAMGTPRSDTDVENVQSTMVRYFSYASPAPACADAVKGTLSAFEGSPAKVKTVIVRGVTATATYDRDLPLGGHRITLRRIAGEWFVDFMPSDGQALQPGLDAPSQCIDSWNTAVDAATISLPDLSYLSDQIWAQLSATSSGCSMILNTPDAFLVFSEQGGGWAPSGSLPYPSAKMMRTVWLDGQGHATPASSASPDGTVSALDGSSAAAATPSETTATPTQVPSTSPEAATTLPPEDMRCGRVHVAAGPNPNASVGTVPPDSCSEALVVMGSYLGNSAAFSGGTDASMTVEGWNCSMVAAGAQCTSGKRKVDANWFFH